MSQHERALANLFSEVNWVHKSALESLLQAVDSVDASSAKTLHLLALVSDKITLLAEVARSSIQRADNYGYTHCRHHLSGTSTN